MAVQILPYAVEHYNSLPELESAKKHFDCVRASDLLLFFGSAFVEHYVENVFRLVLLHKHYDLTPHEKMVKGRSVATPWNITHRATEPTNLHASAWRFSDEGIRPYEFTHGGPEIALDNPSMQPFLLELKARLDKWDLTNTFGICSVPEWSIGSLVTMEFTRGLVIFTEPADTITHDDDVTDIMWQFGYRMLIDSEGQSSTSCTLTS